MKINKTVLKNGLRVVTVPMKDAATVTVMVMVEAGTRYETSENNGLSHFLEHMCFKGTQKRTVRDIAFEVERMGAMTNAFTEYNSTGYYVKGKSRDLTKIFDIVSDVYLNSTFPADELEKERGVICAEIDMYEDSPARLIYDHSRFALYGDQASGMMIAGPKKNIVKFSRQDFIDYHKKYYVSGATAVIVAGNTNHATVTKLVKSYFVGITEKPAIKKPSIKKISGPRKLEKYKPFDQFQVALAARLPHGEHADIPALIVAASILGDGMGSRLFIRLREEMGAAYSVYSYLNPGSDASDVTFFAGTNPAQAEDSIVAIQEEVAKLSQTVVPKDDLQRAQEYLAGMIAMGRERTDDVASHVGNSEILHFKLKTISEMEREIKLVTAADIKRVAKKYFKKDNFHTVTIGPKKAA